MVDENKSLLVLIPTRNRACLAIAAIQSVLGQDTDSVQVLVSDNSTITQEADTLSRFCRQLNDERLHYIAPPKPLPMSPHWNWAMSEALRSGATHFTVLTDRMIFRPGELRPLLELVEKHPERIISYRHDKVVDYKLPVTLLLQEWTGGLFEISSARLLSLTAQVALHESLPRMLNCIVPRTILVDVENHFGAIFDSFAPDFNFCYKALALEDSILFYDKAILIHRALDRSNGQTAARGIVKGDHADFLDNLGGLTWGFAAPIPQLRTIFNAVAHQYHIVKTKPGINSFPDIDMDRYLQLAALDMENFEDENLKLETEKILAAHGWTRQRTPPNSDSASKKQQERIAIKTWLRTKLKSAPTKPVWLLLAKYFAIRPPEINGFTFRSSDEALAYALKFPRRPCASSPGEEAALEYRRI